MTVILAGKKSYVRKATCSTYIKSTEDGYIKYQNYGITQQRYMYTFTIFLKLYQQIIPYTNYNPRSNHFIYLEGVGELPACKVALKNKKNNE
mgnify:CR=1 FL=1